MKKFLILVCSLFLFSIATTAFAADFKLSPSSGTYGSGKQFTVDIKINTFGESVNAAQGKLQFDPDVLEVESISKDGSIFNFWLQEPTFSNSEGIIEFIGGTPNGVAGGTLKIISITFNAKSLGSSGLDFINASITASDGTGQNIFGNANGATFSVSSSGGGSAPAGDDEPQATVAPAPEPVPTPVQIIRTATKATGLPETPILNVELYSDPTIWYNLVSNYTVDWDLPSDISALATEVNSNPNYDIPKNSDGLFDSVTLPAFQEDGVYYVHVRFQNNIGWGETGHYRIALDTEPPLSFEIVVATGESNDNPSPRLVFNTGDSLSGLGSYTISIDNEEPITVSPSQGDTSVEVVQTIEILETGVDFLNVRSEPSVGGDIVTKVNPGDDFPFTDEEDGWYEIVFEEDDLPENGDESGWVFGLYVQEQEVEIETVAKTNEYTLRPHPPGTYMIKLVVSDKAGNGIEARAQVEILPIEKPIITSVNDVVTKGTDELLRVKGTSLPDTRIILTIEDKDQFLVVQQEVTTSENGQWVYELDRELRRGSYFVNARAVDTRGAQSYQTDSIGVKFKDKPIISIAGLDITLRTLVIILIIGIIVAAVVVWRKTVQRRIKMGMEAIVINRDLKNSFGQITKELDETSARISAKGTKLSTKNSEYQAMVGKIKETIERVEKYVAQDIEKLE